MQPRVITYSVSDLSDPRLFDEVKEFFHRHTNRSFHPGNILFQARHEGELIGLVRLCFEERRHILRSMEIKKEYQRQGIGTRLLELFREHAESQAYTPIYCLPYEHLLAFYGQIGFRQALEDELPTFLRLRLEAYRRKRPEAKFAAMIRE